MSNLPTEPGFYWYRYHDKEDWTIADVYQGGSGHLYAEIGNKTRRLPDWDGQWQRCIRPDELATLRAKEEAYDKGQEAWAVFNRHGTAIGAGPTAEYAIATVTGPSNSGEFYDKDFWLDALKSGYTCRKVKIVEVVE